MPKKKCAIIPGQGHRSGESKGASESTEEAVETAFEDVMAGSTYFDVCPNACVPIANIRPISRSGVARLKAHIVGRTIGGKSFGLGGLVQGTDTALIVPIRGTLRPLLKEYFISRGLSTNEAKTRSEARETWFGIVNGAHMHAAILEIMEAREKGWEGFKWKVTLLQGGFSIGRYRQLARAQNQRQDHMYFVETTLSDTLIGLKEECERMTRERNGKKPSAADVARSYDGMPLSKDSTIKQTASTAARLTRNVLSTLGEIMSAEHPEICVGMGVMNPSGKLSADEIMEVADCRLYRKFISLTCIKSATLFMNAKGVNGEKSQVNALHRVKSIFDEQSYKPVSHGVLSEQYQIAMDAVCEERKFLQFLDGETWPTEMQVSRANMLRGTTFDGEIIENRGNDYDILPSILNRYRQLFPHAAPMKEAKYRANKVEVPVCGQLALGDDQVTQNEKGAEKNLPTDINPTPNVPNNKAPGTVENFQRMTEATTPEVEQDTPESEVIPILVDMSGATQEGENVQATEDPEKSVEDAKTSELPEIQDTSVTRDESLTKDADADLKLKKLGIFTHQMTWQTYDKTVRSRTASRVDGIVCNPPYGVSQGSVNNGRGFVDEVDDMEMSEFAQFCKRCIKSGGYVFLFTSMHYFPKWEKSFVECKFNVMKYPYVLIKNDEQLQRRPITDFPQNIAEFALIAKAPGLHPERFKPEYSSPFHLVNCSLKRRFSAIYNVPVPRSKLTYPNSKSPIRVEEKSVDLLAEILDLFVPEEGSVLDPYAGTLTTAIACMSSKRTCECIEKDPSCFREAHARLRLRVTGIPFYETANQDTEARVSTVSRATTLDSDQSATNASDVTTKGDAVSADITSDYGSQRTESAPTSMTVVNAIPLANGEIVSPKADNRPIEKSTDLDKTLVTKRSVLKHNYTGENVRSRKHPSTVLPTTRRSKRKKTGNDVPESTTESPTSHLTNARRVMLMIGDTIVGKAECHKPSDGSGTFERRLHGFSLEKVEKDGQYLITIRGVHINALYGGTPYPYETPGQEESPNVLSEMYSAGMYSWDARELRCCDDT